MFQFQGSGRVLVKHLLNESSTMAAPPSESTFEMFNTSWSSERLERRSCSAMA